MIVHEHARRYEVLTARPLHEEPARKRLAGRCTDTTDDKGRETMPFDLFTARPSDVVELIAEVFGEKPPMSNVGHEPGQN